MDLPLVIRLRAINQANEIEYFYLHLKHTPLPQGKQILLPTVLGTGRNAVVLLATTTPDRESYATDYRAVKFLKDHIDRQYARASAGRFFLEATNATRFHRLQGAFVKYYGWGAIGRPYDLLPYEERSSRDYWWDDIFNLPQVLMLLTGSTEFSDQFIDLADRPPWEDILSQPDIAASIAADQKNIDELQRLRVHYNLQGPFYVQHLCQGTLNDLLDRKTPWHELPAYSIPGFKYSIEQQSRRLQKDISAVANLYLRSYQGQLSGYDILNHFRIHPVANQVRGFAVLELFSQVVYTVAQLHLKQTRDPNHRPLAHRDLKPGNLFIQHDANFDGWNHLNLLLSDLGYVTAPEQIISGDFSLVTGQQGNQALGSQ
jgi:serine/threonine protein kinase